MHGTNFYKLCQLVTVKGSKALIEGEVSVLGSFQLQCFDDLIDEAEVWRLIENKVHQLVHSYTPTSCSEPATEAPTSSAQVQELEARLTALKTAHNVVDRENAQLKEKINEMKEKLSKAENEKEEKLSTATTELMELKTQNKMLSTTNKELMELKGKLSTASTELIELKEKISTVETQLKEEKEKAENANE